MEQKQTFPHSVGCVIMASGLGRRFSACPDHYKLMAEFHNQPLIAPVLNLAKALPFSQVVLVTRNPDVETFAKAMSIPVLLHTMPDKNHTIKLGLSHLLEENPYLSGCMFCVADQPLLSGTTLENLLFSFSENPHKIIRTGTFAAPGNPILFPADFFPELLQLPSKCGGSFLTKKYPEQVLYVPVQDDLELFDVDTCADLEHLRSKDF